MSVPKEFQFTLCETYRTLCILVRQPITEVKVEWNVAADVWEIAKEEEIKDIQANSKNCGPPLGNKFDLEIGQRSRSRSPHGTNRKGLLQ